MIAIKWKLQEDTEDGVLEMYTGKDIAPGFFVWAIPTGFVITESEGSTAIKPKMVNLVRKCCRI